MDFWDECVSEAGIATIRCIPGLIGHLVTIAISAAGAVALFFVVWGGIKFIRSGGDPKQLENARHTIMYAIIGMIIVFMAYFIVGFVARVTGVDCIRIFGFTNCLAQPPADQETIPSQQGDV